jgi:hypothetical protein
MPTDDRTRPMAEKTPRKAASTVPKKRWERPSMKTGHLFESNSLACGKSGPELDQCIQNPLSS